VVEHPFADDPVEGSLWQPRVLRGNHQEARLGSALPSQLDHPRGEVERGQARAATQQLVRQIPGAAADLQHFQPGHRAERLEQRRIV
jgi:hypothetical protein